MCTNDNCAGKLLGKLCHSVSKNALNIEGLSEATIQKFIDLGWLKSIRDIYYLYLHITIVSHGYANNLKLKEECVKDKLFKEIFDNSCNAEFIGVNWETHNDKSHVDMSNSIFVDDSIRNLETSNAKYKILYGEYMDWNNTNIEFIRCKNWLDLNNQICLIERF